MMKGFHLVCAGAVCTLFLTITCFSAIGQRGKKKSKYPLPQRCAGITVGFSTDADVQRLYGKGYFIQDEGHAGGRYYVDPKHKVTLHIEIGTDDVIQSVDYEQGIDLPFKPTHKVWEQATTAHLTTDETVQGGIGLGAQSETVIRCYGKPKKNKLRNGRGAIEYHDNYRTNPDVLFYDGEFRFKNNRLAYISLYDGD